MTPPAILMGMHFPVAVRAVVGHDKKLGGPVGALYGANSLGGAAGAFVAGFVLLPNLGIQGTIAVAAVAGLVAGAVLLLPALGRLEARLDPPAFRGPGRTCPAVSDPSPATGPHVDDLGHVSVCDRVQRP
ncbi:fused MFS/spermidine synthase [Devosia ginsengisoli]|uniref:fused MFS/spermidine synthase n=1 Tax=Devosia ginsengisoli TaxID=400770 RepID=UPI0034E97C6A